MKRFLILCLALLLLGGAVSCNRQKETTNDPYFVDEETRKLYDTVVLTIDGTPVTYETYRYYFYGIGTAMAGEDKEYWKDGKNLEEVRKAVLEELQLQQAMNKLAEKYNIAIDDDEWKKVDEYLKQIDFYYQSNLGISFLDDLKKNYGTYEVYRQMYAAGRYINDPVYEYLYDKKNGVVDLSKEAIAEYMKDFHCTLHILLTEENYDSKEKAEELAKALHTILTVADSAGKELSESSTVQELNAAIERIEKIYEETKSASSYVGSFSPYMDRLAAVKGEFSSDTEHPAIAYFKKCADKLTGSDTPITTLQKFATSLSEKGITKDSKKECEDALKLYSDMIEKERTAFFETQSKYPTGAKMDALFALQLMESVIDGKVPAFAVKTVQSAFSNAVRIFGEDHEDPEYGVYFRKGETNDEFEDAFFKLQMNEISMPVKTEYGVHLILRTETNADFFGEMLYEGYFIEDLITDMMDAQKVEYKELYNTVTMETLK